MLFLFSLSQCYIFFIWQSSREDQKHLDLNFFFGMGKEIQNNSLYCCCSNSSKPTDFHRRPLHVLAFGYFLSPSPSRMARCCSSTIIRNLIILFFFFSRGSGIEYGQYCLLSRRSRWMLVKRDVYSLLLKKLPECPRITLNDPFFYFIHSRQ